MKIEYSNYYPNGQYARRCRIESISRNVYNYRNLYEKFADTPTWYTQYNLATNRYTKYSNTTGEVIAEGEMSNGYFEVHPKMNRTLVFERKVDFKGYPAIELTERINSVQNRIVVLHNDFLSTFMDQEYWNKFLLYAKPGLGPDFENYGVVALRQNLLNTMYKTMFEITEIDL